MDKNYTVVETSKIAAVRGGGHIYSLISDDEVQNGHIGFVGDLAADVEGLETHEFVVPSAATIGKKRAVLVANPEWDYDETRRSNQALYNYINEADKPFRAYGLMEGDMYAVSAPGIDADEPVVGKYVILADGKTTVKMVEEAATAGQGFVGRIIGSAKRGLGWTTKGGRVYGRPYIVYFIEILRNDIVG
jgi:hypothetical protein